MASSVIVAPRCIVSARASTNQSVSGSPGNAIAVFSSVAVDTLGVFANNTFTTPRNGIYEIMATVRMQNNGATLGYFRVGAFINGGSEKHLSVGLLAAADIRSFSGSLIMPLNQGDALDIRLSNYGSGLAYQVQNEGDITNILVKLL
jgi:hypothetical protein